MKSSLLIFTVASFSCFSAFATSNYEICSDASATVSVENGDVTIKENSQTLTVGPAISTTLLRTISEKTERCVDGAPEYSSTTVTVKKVKYFKYEEGPAVSAVVLCELTQTGVMTPGSCKTK